MSSFTPPQVVICDFIYSVYLCAHAVFFHVMKSLNCQASCKKHKVYHHKRRNAWYVCYVLVIRRY